MLERQDTTRFLKEHWQKTPSFMPKVMDAQLPQLSPGELAWLATLPDVESRLVFTDRNGDDIRYRVETGPFDDAALSGLPERNWTLLVHDVEKHLPDFRAYLALVDFIPDWRIDDLMVSCAAPGGSVGPHVDNYDVFLCQGEGTREWAIGYPGEFEVDAKTECLSLVKPFDTSADYKAGIGDVLYLPPRISHWGIASELCTTYSIGCRAPSRRELELAQERVLGKTLSEGCESSEPVLYSDPDLSVTEALSGCIDANTLRRIREQRLLDASLGDVELARIVGCAVSDPKAWLMPEPIDEDTFDRVLGNPAGLEVHGMARLAWIDIGEHQRVFVNGADREINGQELKLVRQLSTERRLDMASVLPEEHQALLVWLAREGLFDAGQAQE